MSLRVAILCEYPTLNGGERSILTCVDHRAAERIEFIFFAPAHGPLADALQRRRVQHVPFDLHAGAAKASRDEAIDQLAKTCTDECDLLHANSLSMGRLTGAAAGRINIPCTAHLRDILRLSPAAIRDLNGNAQLVAVSHAVRDFHTAQGLDAERVRVIYNGIDCGTFRPRPRTGSLRRELDLPHSAFLVATIGQICLRKGQDVFAESAIPIAAAIPDAHFLLIGTRHSTKPESIDFESGIAERFHAAGLADRFHPLGERTDVPPLLNEIDVLVHAARQEPFGRVLLEAAAAGVPIVATDVGGTREMLTEGLHALLVPPDDPQAIANAVTELAANSELAAQFGRTAHEHVAAQFPIERSARELLKLWQSLAKSPAR